MEKPPPLCGFFRGPGETPVFSPNEVDLKRGESDVGADFTPEILAGYYTPGDSPTEVGEKKCPVQWMDGWKLGI